MGSRGEPLPLSDGEIILYRALFSPEESDAYFRRLLEEVSWQSRETTLFGRRRRLPRLTAWHGDPGRVYIYSGIQEDPRPWTPLLEEIKGRIETVSPVRFNSALLNLYRNERDSVSWHRDDEPELGADPVIGSVSFGATRRFQLRHRQERERRVTLALPSGSYLLMQGTTQQFWEHRVPKETKPCGARVNLTFRVIR